MPRIPLLKLVEYHYQRDGYGVHGIGRGYRIEKKEFVKFLDKVKVK